MIESTADYLNSTQRYRDNFVALTGTIRMIEVAVEDNVPIFDPDPMGNSPIKQVGGHGDYWSGYVQNGGFLNNGVTYTITGVQGSNTNWSSIIGTDSGNTSVAGSNYYSADGTSDWENVKVGDSFTVRQARAVVPFDITVVGSGTDARVTYRNPEFRTLGLIIKGVQAVTTVGMLGDLRISDRIIDESDPSNPIRIPRTGRIRMLLEKSGGVPLAAPARPDRQVPAGAGTTTQVGSDSIKSAIVKTGLRENAVTVTETVF